MKGEFFPYLLANYPTPDLFFAALQITARYAGRIEIGLPFTDPVADGPVIQQATAAVLEKGFEPDAFLSMLRHARLKIPVALMTYANVVHAYGLHRFCNDARKAGAVSLIVPDVPYEESRPWREAASAGDMRWISFVSLTTSGQRLARITAEAQDFIYLLALTGITGSQIHSRETILQKAAEIRKHTRIPIALGFGIKSAEDALPFAGAVDAFIVGSRIVEILREENPLQELEKFYRGFA